MVSNQLDSKLFDQASIQFPESVFVLTGSFEYGDKSKFAEFIRSQGGRLEQSVTHRTNYVLVGNDGSDEWVNGSSGGRKIQRTLELKAAGEKIYIISEYHFCDKTGFLAGESENESMRLRRVLFDLAHSMDSNSGPIHLIVPEGIEEIPDNFFKNRDEIGCLTLPDSLKTIGTFSFYQCKNLKTIKFGNHLLEINAGAFKNCQQLERLELPERLQTIGIQAFHGCGELKRVKLPSTLEVVGIQAFQDCQNLNQVEISYGVQGIEGEAFSGCESLETINLPESLEYIGHNAFQNTRLKESNRRDGFFSVDGWLLDVEHWAMTEEVTIPVGVKVINGAFKGCEKLKKVDLPMSLKRIGYSAFDNCTSLKTIVLPENVLEIGSYAFNGCTRLENITFSPRLKKVGYAAFSSCEGFTDIELPDGLRVISNHAFSGCRNLKSVTILDGVVHIGDSAFFNTALIHVKLPPSVRSIGETAFGLCKKLSSVDLPNVKTIGENAFIYCPSLREIHVASLEFVEKVSIFDDVKLLFMPKVALTKPMSPHMKISATIGYCSNPQAYEDVVGKSYKRYLRYQVKAVLHEIVRLGFVEAITYFKKSDLIKASYLDELLEISMSSNQVEMKAMLLDYQNLKDSHVDPFMGEEYQIGSIDDEVDLSNEDATKEWVFENVADGGLSILEYKGSDAHVHVPQIIEGKKVRLVGDFHPIFAPSAKIISIEIPPTVKKIGMHSFKKCHSLQSISLPDSIKEVGWSAFEECTSLKSVKLPSGLTKLRSGLFYHCTSLEKVIYPELVKEVENYCFSGCENLNHLPLLNEIERIGEDAFNDTKYFKNTENWRDGLLISQGWLLAIQTDRTGLIEVPKDVRRIANKAFSPLHGGVREVRLPEKLEHIGEGAFRFCRAITNLVVPNQVKHIEPYTFSACTKLQSIHLPKGLLSIGESAFEGCENLEDIHLPEGLQTIDKHAFKGCSKLEKIHLPKSLVSIGDEAFYECKKLDIDSEVLEGPLIGKSAFAKTKFYNNKDNWVDLHLILRNLYIRSRVKQSGVILIPSGINTIASGAFSGCDEAQKIIVPAGVKSIGDNAFEKCIHLKEVVLSHDLEWIGESAFWKCEQLEAIVLPEKVEEIRSSLFEGCLALETIEILGKVKHVHEKAFSKCFSLKRIKAFEMEDLSILDTYRGMVALALPKVPITKMKPQAKKISAVMGYLDYTENYDAEVASSYDQYMEKRSRQLMEKFIDKEHYDYAKKMLLRLDRHGKSMDEILNLAKFSGIQDLVDAAEAIMK